MDDLKGGLAGAAIGGIGGALAGGVAGVAYKEIKRYRVSQSCRIQHLNFLNDLNFRNCIFF